MNKVTFHSVFPLPKPVIGMIHVFKNDSLFEQKDRALRDLYALQKNGVDAVLIENYGWGYKDANHAHEVVREILLEICDAVYKEAEIPVGVNVLPNDYEKSFFVAYNGGGDFIQLDHITGSFIGHESVDPKKFLNMRRFHENILVFGGVHPKYYTLADPHVSIADSAKIAMNLCDAIVVTGKKKGGETALQDLMDVKSATSNSIPVIIGSGLTASNASRQLDIADGAIVGSFFKKDGEVLSGASVNPDRVFSLMHAVRRSRHFASVNRPLTENTKT